MSPIKVRKVRGRSCFETIDDKKHRHAKCTTYQKASAQKRIIEAARKKK